VGAVCPGAEMIGVELDRWCRHFGCGVLTVALRTG
jgi:hypothetical protein